MKAINAHLLQLIDANNRILLLPGNEGIELIRICDISYIEAARAYCTLYFFSGQSLLVSKPLKELANQLNSKRFFRVHHSYLVNVSAIQRILKKDGDVLELLDGKLIPLAQRRKESFIEFISLRKQSARSF